MKEIKDEAGFTSLWSVTADKVDQEGIQSYTCTHIDSPSNTSSFIKACSVITVQPYDI